MMRVLILALLLLNFSITFTGCTSPGSSDDAEEASVAENEASSEEEEEEEEDEEETSAEDDSEEEPEDEAEAKAQTEPESEEESELEDGSENEELLAEDDESVDDALEEKLEEEPVDELDKELEEEKVAEEKPKTEPAKKEPEDVVEDSDEDLALLEEDEEPAPAPVKPAPVVPEKVKIINIRYVSSQAGGTVLIESSKPVSYQTRMNPTTNQYVIEMANVILPANLQRPLQTRNFKSTIVGINAYQTKGSSTARVVVQLDSTDGREPTVQQEGTSLVLIPPSAPMVAKAPPASTEPKKDDTKKVLESKGPLSAQNLNEFLTGSQVFYGKPLSLQVKDVDVRDVINFIADESGANIVMSDDVIGSISLKLRRIPWDQALVTVMRSKGLGYARQGNVLRISTMKSLQEESEAATKMIESQKAVVPEVVQVLPVSYANLDDLVKNLTPFLSKAGRIVADGRTSSVVVTDKEDSVNRVAQLLKTFDVPPTQVSIESKVVEAQEQFERFIGVTWSQRGSPYELSPNGGFQRGPIELTLRTTSASLSGEFQSGAPFSMNLNVGTLDFFGDLGAALTLAERDSLAKVISAPRISTMNREKATIRQEGENLAVITTRNDLTSTVTKQTQRTPFKLELSVVPQITADGSVIMDMEVTREFLGAVVDNEIQARPVNKRYAKTKVLVRNGQTAVIGGIFTSDELENTNGVPLLRNIPILGWLFKNKSVNRAKNELLVFMTPRILGLDVAGAPKAAANATAPDSTQEEPVKSTN